MINLDFNDNHITYAVAGLNIDEIRPKLSQAGFRYNRELGWHSPEILPVPDGYTLIPVYYNSVYNEFGRPRYSTDIVSELYEKPKYPESTFFGKEGERIKDLPFTIIDKKRVTIPYNSERNQITFKYGNNIFIWITKSNILNPYEVGETVLLTGSIKEHKEYKKSKVNFLIRCIIKPCTAGAETDE